LYTGGEWREESRELKVERKEDNTETRKEVPESVVESAAKIWKERGTVRNDCPTKVHSDEAG
jgi:hypothetical protein